MSIASVAAYSKTGWSNIVYVGASWYSISVGAGWVIENLPGMLENITFGPQRRKAMAS